MPAPLACISTLRSPSLRQRDCRAGAPFSHSWRRDGREGLSKCPHPFTGSPSNTSIFGIGSTGHMVLLFFCTNVSTRSSSLFWAQTVTTSSALLPNAVRVYGCHVTRRWDGATRQRSPIRPSCCHLASRWVVPSRFTPTMNANPQRPYPRSAVSTSNALLVFPGTVMRYVNPSKCDVFCFG